MRERFNEIPGTARQSFFNQSLVRFPQILLSTDIGEAQPLHYIRITASLSQRSEELCGSPERLRGWERHLLRRYRFLA
jgi:hypothetical protein